MLSSLHGNLQPTTNNTSLDQRCAHQSTHFLPAYHWLNSFSQPTISCLLYLSISESYGLFIICSPIDLFIVINLRGRMHSRFTNQWMSTWTLFCTQVSVVRLSTKSIIVSNIRSHTMRVSIPYPFHATSNPTESISLRKRLGQVIDCCFMGVHANLLHSCLLHFIVECAVH